MHPVEGNDETREEVGVSVSRCFSLQEGSETIDCTTLASGKRVSGRGREMVNCVYSHRNSCKPSEVVEICIHGQ